MGRALLLAACPRGLQVMPRPSLGAEGCCPYRLGWSPMHLTPKEIRNKTRLVAQEGNHTPLSLGHQRSETAGQPLPGEVVLFSDASWLTSGVFLCGRPQGGSLRRAVTTAVSSCVSTRRTRVRGASVRKASSSTTTSRPARVSALRCFSHREELCHLRGERDGRRGRRAPSVLCSLRGDGGAVPWGPRLPGQEEEG